VQALHLLLPRSRSPGIDALIAATARVHGLTVVTRNAKDFELAGVQVISPSPNKLSTR
jgi:predicted nucleic acid-binding protein